MSSSFYIQNSFIFYPIAPLSSLSFLLRCSFLSHSSTVTIFYPFPFTTSSTSTRLHTFLHSFTRCSSVFHLSPHRPQLRFYSFSQYPFHLSDVYYLQSASCISSIGLRFKSAQGRGDSSTHCARASARANDQLTSKSETPRASRVEDSSWP